MGFFYHMLQPPVKRTRWLRVTVMLASLAGAFGLRLYLDPWLRWHSPFALLLPAVLVSAWYGGARAGLLATAVGAVGAVYGFMMPVGFVIGNLSDAVAFVLFIVEGTLLSGLCEVLHLAVDRAQTAAREAGRKFEVLANSAPVLIWSTDAAGRCVFVNHHWCLFTGRTREQELNAGWPANLHEDDVAAYRRTYAHALTQQSPYQCEYRLRRADGTFRWLLEHASPRRDADGQFEGFIGSCTDITSFRREREDLDFVARLQRNLGASLDLERVAAALAQATVPHLADWFCLELVAGNGRREILRTYQADPQRAAAVPALARLPASALVVETGETLFTSRVDSSLPEAGSVQPAHRQQLQELGLISHVAVPLLARGRIIGVLTLATAESDRILGHEELALVQKIAGIAGFALDNARLHHRTRRALAGAEQARQRVADSERELGRQRTLLKTIIDAVPAMVAYIGPDGCVQLHNERFPEWFGQGSGAVVAQPLAAVTGSEASVDAAAHVSAALAGETVSYEMRLHSTGPGRQVAATLQPDCDQRGRVRGVVFHAYDITERSRAYAELATARELLRCHANELEARVRERTETLRETNAELEAFTFSVSHDLRTPLQFIRSFTDAVGEDRGNRLSAASRGHLAQITRASRRMEAIIHDLLDYSRLGRADISLTTLSLEEAVAEAISQHQGTIQRTGAQVLVDSPLPGVRADHVGLFQILSNLLSNSLKFTSPGRAAVIRLRAEPSADFTRLWIMDNGIGVPVQHHEKIFQLFERLHSPAEYPGTGLGLALVRKAVKRIGGRCGLESAPEAGSRFWIDFPAAS